jgi:hypothetical protein
MGKCSSAETLLKSGPLTGTVWRSKGEPGAGPPQAIAPKPISDSPAGRSQFFGPGHSNTS